MEATHENRRPRSFARSLSFSGTRQKSGAVIGRRGIVLPVGTYIIRSMSMAIDCVPNDCRPRAVLEDVDPTTEDPLPLDDQNIPEKREKEKG